MVTMSIQPQYIVFAILILLGLVTVGIGFWFPIKHALREGRRRSQYNHPSSLAARKRHHINDVLGWLYISHSYERQLRVAQLERCYEDKPYRREKYRDWDFSLWFIVIGGIWALLVSIGFVPFNSYYYYNYTVAGTVTHINGVLDTSGKYTNNDFAVKLSGHANEVKLEDTRIIGYKGKHVTLLCGPQWVYQAQPILNCSIVGD
jgi:hypothetical protein